MKIGFPEAESPQAHRYALFAVAIRANTRPVRGHSSEEERRRERVQLWSLPVPEKKHPDTASADPRSRANERRALTFHCAAIDGRRSLLAIGDPLAARATNFRSERRGGGCSHRTVRPVPGQLRPL